MDEIERLKLLHQSIDISFQYNSSIYDRSIKYDTIFNFYTNMIDFCDDFPIFHTKEDIKEFLHKNPYIFCVYSKTLDENGLSNVFKEKSDLLEDIFKSRNPTSTQPCSDQNFYIFVKKVHDINFLLHNEIYKQLHPRLIKVHDEFKKCSDIVECVHYLLQNREYIPKFILFLNNLNIHCFKYNEKESCMIKSLDKIICINGPLMLEIDDCYYRELLKKLNFDHLDIKEKIYFFQLYPQTFPLFYFILPQTLRDKFKNIDMEKAYFDNPFRLLY